MYTYYCLLFRGEGKLWENEALLTNTWCAVPLTCLVYCWNGGGPKSSRPNQINCCGRSQQSSTSVGKKIDQSIVPRQHGCIGGSKTNGLSARSTPRERNAVHDQCRQRESHEIAVSRLQACCSYSRRSPCVPVRCINRAVRIIHQVRLPLQDPRGRSPLASLSALS